MEKELPVLLWPLVRGLRSSNAGLKHGRKEKIPTLGENHILDNHPIPSFSF
jgi:hypothetical protein